MPLSAKNLLKFDKKKAQDWFFEKEGLPYGYHNFLWGWIDTERDNYPPILANELVPVLMALLDKVIPSSIDILYS